MTRRVRLLVLLLAVLAAAVSSTGIAVAGDAPARETSTELRPTILSAATVPAQIVTNERRESSSEGSGKVNRLALIAVLAVAALSSARGFRAARASRGGPPRIVPRARHLGRSPPAFVVV